MNKIILKLFFILTFILSLCVKPAYADFLDINAVRFDNSGSFMTINSTDNLDYPLSEKPKIIIDAEKQEAYFDLQPVRINSNKSYIIDTNEISEINLQQISKTPDIVRITILYKNGFNPENIRIKRLHNTLFVTFKNTVMSNYYFQDVYKESDINTIYEKINIQQKIQSQKNIVGEINAAFTNQTTENTDNNFVLVAKNMLLKTKYYINSVIIKGETPILNGIGVYTLTKPIYLSSPNRVAFDVKNTTVNQLLRNNDINLGTDTIKIGQFDHNTARIVITAERPEIYMPVIYGETQKLAFLNTVKTSPLNLYSEVTNMTSVTQEKGETNIYSAKFTFSKPIVMGINRKTNKMELSIFNLNNYFTGAINSELRKTPFEKINIADIKSGGVKFTIPTNNGDKIDIYTGADGKTLRIKMHTASQYISKEEPIEPKIVIPTVVQNHVKGKKYIFIDAGHGGSDCGALRNNINEKDITLDIAKKVQSLLEKKGYIVAMARTDDTYVSLQERVDASEIFNPDIFVSIHVNSSNSESPSGIETHYYKDNSLKLAKYLHASMLNNINTKDRGLFKSKFYVINHTTAPAVLLETGFISNPNERAQLITESRKNATAKAIVEGIDEYFKNE